MAKQINLTNFFKKIEDYENMQDLWCAKLVENGRQTIQSVCNNIDNQQLTSLMDSFVKFVSLLVECNPNFTKTTLKQREQSLKQQNKSLELLPKNDIIKMVNNDLQCPICSEWLLRATSANCNHTFCEKCIKKWLTINKTCPVCRSTIQHTSTSLAIDNFISNLCQLIGGFIKERRESVKNAQNDHGDSQDKLNHLVDGLYNDLNISESIVEDTYYSSLLETTTSVQHPNMARIIPLQSNTPEARINLRQAPVGPNNVHHNTVELSPFPRSSGTSSRPYQIQSTFTLVGSPQLDSFQSTSASALSHRNNGLQPKPFVSVKRHCQPMSLISTASPRANCSKSKSTTAPVNVRTNCIQPSSSTTTFNLHDRFRLVDTNNNRNRTNTNSNSPARNNCNKPNLLLPRGTNIKTASRMPRTRHQDRPD